MNEHRERRQNPVRSRRASSVALYVYDTAEVELAATERLRLSRLAYSPADGFVLEPYGDLIGPGTTRLRLEVGVYHFKSIRDVQLRIHQAGAVQVMTPQGPLTDTPEPMGVVTDAA